MHFNCISSPESDQVRVPSVNESVSRCLFSLVVSLSSLRTGSLAIPHLSKLTTSLQIGEMRGL